MSKDPVGGVDVDESKARAAGRMSEYQGQTYFFGSNICKQNFDKEQIKSRNAMWARRRKSKETGCSSQRQHRHCCLIKRKCWLPTADGQIGQR